MGAYNFILACVFLTFSIKANSVIKSDGSQWLRLPNDLGYLKPNRQKTYLAYLDNSTQKLFILNLKSKDSYIATHNGTKNFFWAPYGSRLFLKEIESKSGKNLSKLSYFDVTTKSTKTILQTVENISEFTLDPLDQKIAYLENGKIKSVAINYTESKIASWQKLLKNSGGHWIIGANAIVWKSSKTNVDKVVFDLDAISSYDISPDGELLIFATQNDLIYTSEKGSAATFLDFGKDPSWNPHKKQILYSGARLIGKTIVGYDLKISSVKGEQKWLTDSPTNERWPTWMSSSKILYTKAQTTDLFLLELK
jgi:hypothetical protein